MNLLDPNRNTDGTDALASVDGTTWLPDFVNFPFDFDFEQLSDDFETSTIMDSDNQAPATSPPVQVYRFIVIFCIFCPA